jgi:hypothetical protein
MNAITKQFPLTDGASKRQFLVTLCLSAILVSHFLFAQALEVKPDGAAFAKFQPRKAPKTAGLLVKRGDRVAICGDSITEQKMYSRIMEDYLTVCVPELQVTVRQYGWSGERAPGFLGRMTNDCLRFAPTLATTCYGMNDHEYRPYEERIGRTYEASSRAIIESFKAHKARVVLGSPGCVGKMPSWVKSATGTVEDLNLSLCQLRNLDIDLAQREQVRFADVFWPMFTAGVTAQREYGADYAIAGKDGVHPGWSGQTLMAYAFLKAMGLKGDIGVFTVDLKKGTIKASKGHEVISAQGGEYSLRSRRYPFCACLENGQGGASYPVCGKDDPTKDDSIRSAQTLVPFNPELNRLMLVAKNGTAASYGVTWGNASRKFTREELAKGVNLAEAFPCNPFCEAFARVDAAVAAKQAYETRQIKEVFHGAEGKADMEKAVLRTEQEREPLARAICSAFVPVTHTIRIVAQ